MTDVGRNLATLLQQVRTLHSEVAKLLESSNALLGVKGWQPHNNTAVAGGSTALYNPAGWLPQDASQFYSHGGGTHEQLVAYVSVVFFDRDDSNLVLEPLLTAGYFDYGAGKTARNNWDYWFAHTHVWIPGRRDDGHLVTAGTDGWKNWKPPFRSVTTLGISLVSVQSTDELEERLLLPLLRKIEGIEVASSPPSAL